MIRNRITWFLASFLALSLAYFYPSFVSSVLAAREYCQVGSQTLRACDYGYRCQGDSAIPQDQKDQGNNGRCIPMFCRTSLTTAASSDCETGFQCVRADLSAIQTDPNAVGRDGVCQSVDAQPTGGSLTCPADFDGALSVNPQGKTDMKPVNLRYTYNMPADSVDAQKSVSFGVKAEIHQNVYSGIFANYFNVLAPFVQPETNAVQKLLESDPATLARWDKLYCVDAETDVQAGQVQLSADGVFKYRKPFPTTQPAVCPGETACDPFTGECPKNCEEDTTDIREVTYNGGTKSDSQDIQLPYVMSARQIAWDVAHIVKDQYCLSSAANSCPTGYECKVGPKYAIPPNDPAGYGKDGICEITDMTLAGDTAKRMVNLMCTESAAGTDKKLVGTVDSKICLYSNEGYAFTDNDTTGTPRIAEQGSNIEKDGSNRLPFDIDLFANNGEQDDRPCTAERTDCKLDGYYRHALGELGPYSNEDLKAMDNIPVKADVGLEMQDAKGAAGGAPWTFDFIDKLGGIKEMTEFYRMMTTTLQPDGFGVMSTGDHQAYLKYVNGVRLGMLFIDNEAVSFRKRADGTIMDQLQSPPFIHKQQTGKGYVVSLITPRASGPRGQVILSDGHRAGAFEAVPGTENMNKFAPFMAFMNSRAQVVLLARLESGMHLGVYNSGQPVNWIPLGGGLQGLARADLDSKDQLHIIGIPNYDSGEVNQPDVYYQRFNFSGATIAPLTQPVRIPLSNAGPYLTSGGKAFSIQSSYDNCGPSSCPADVVVSVQARQRGSQFDNDLLYIKINADGSNSGAEVAVSRADDSMTGYPPPATDFMGIHALTGNGPNVLTYGGYTYIVYIMTDLRFQTRINGRPYKASQVLFAQRVGLGNWIQNKHLSSKIMEEQGEFLHASIGRYGQVAFTINEKVVKYNSKDKTFDSAGYKRCVFNPVSLNAGYGGFIGVSHECGKNTSEMFEVLPPSTEGVMKFVALPQP